MDNLNELFGQVGICERASLVAQTVESACNAGDLVREEPLEKGMATYSSILTWEI